VRRSHPHLVRRGLKLALVLLFSTIFLFVALFARTKRRPPHSSKPRILWGPIPIAGTQYYSRTCQSLGYQSNTLMYGRYVISKAEDFDYYPETLFPYMSKLPFFWLFYPYLCFLWALPKYEIHFHNFDGGLLRGTPLEYWEIRFRHLAGAKDVLYPYGGDVLRLDLTPGLLFKHALLTDYPHFGKIQPIVERHVDHYLKFADFIYVSVDSVDYLPYWNFILMQLSAIDTDAVNPAKMKTGELRQRYRDKKIVFHAPNHRHIKGTGMLITACEELRAEGRDDFELVIYERQPNDAVLQGIHDSDIVADSFIHGVYGMFAIEGMALGKPVMCYLRPDLYELYSHYSWAKECPVVNTPLNRIKENLVWLLDHTNERERIGLAGRHFVEQHHSIDAMGKIYDAIIRKVWYGTNELDLIRNQTDARAGKLEQSSRGSHATASHRL